MPITIQDANEISGRRQFEETYDFEIPGMSCADCSARIKSLVIAEPYCREISIDIVTKRAKITVNVDEAKRFNPNDTALGMLLKVINANPKFKPRWISPDSAKEFYFNIEGLQSPRDATRIKESLLKKEDEKANFQRIDVDFSTSRAMLITTIDDDRTKMEAFQEQLCRLIENAIDFPEIKVSVTQGPPKDEDEESKSNIQRSWHYLYKARANLLLGLALFFFQAMIPLPVTWFGQAIGLLVGTVTFGVMWYSAKEFFVDAWQELTKNGSSNMSTLIALGTGSAWLYSMILVFFPALFPVAALQYEFLAINMILGIINVGKFAKAWAQEKANHAVVSKEQVLSKYQPSTAKKIVAIKGLDLSKMTVAYFDENKSYIKVINPLEKIDYDKIMEKYILLQVINYDQIKQGDIIVVMPGQRFPVEGIILNPVETFVDEFISTGETVAKQKEKDSFIDHSGNMNETAPVFIRATTDGDKGKLTALIRKISKASASNVSVSKLVDKLSKVFVPTIIGFACLTGLAWFFLGPVPVLPWVIKGFMATLLCACPCMLGLATPISTHISINKLAEEDIVVHDAVALETIERVNTVVFDKSGTLTNPVVRDIYIPENDSILENIEMNKEDILQYVASLEQGLIVKEKCTNPIAQSFLMRTQRPFLPATEVERGNEHQGVFGKVNGVDVMVGTAMHLESRFVEVPAEFKKKQAEYALQGKSASYIAIKGICVGIAGLEHDVREDAKKVVTDLRNLGIKVVMLTGTAAEASEVTAKKLGIHVVYSKHSPEMKEKKILELKEVAHKMGGAVMMIGDGVNDISANHAADVGVAVGALSGATTTCQIILRNHLKIPNIIVNARETMGNIRQNLYWTAFYNIISLIAATGILYPLTGFVLNPVVASIAMAFSSVIVVLNSTRLSLSIDNAICRQEGKQTTSIFTWGYRLFDVGNWKSYLGFKNEPIKPQKPAVSAEIKSVELKHSLGGEPKSHSAPNVPVELTKTMKFSSPRLSPRLRRLAKRELPPLSPRPYLPRDAKRQPRN